MIPKFHKLMLPILKFTADESVHTNSEILEKVAIHFKLTPEEMEERLPSGLQTVIYNRTVWSIVYLRKAKLIENSKRSEFRITKRGLDLLKENPSEITVKLLKRYEEFQDFQNTSSSDEIESTQIVQIETPTDLMAKAHKQLSESLKFEILDKLYSIHPFKFEEIVIKVLLNLGYGGSFEDAGKALKRSGDEGIDGFINEDRLGLDVIYVQAKRYSSDNKISRPTVQSFCGALMGKKARKGIFITTSSFTREAEDYVKNLDAKIILINGDQLAQLMIDTNSGVEIEYNYYVKKINLDFFE